MTNCHFDECLFKQALPSIVRLIQVMRFARIQGLRLLVSFEFEKSDSIVTMLCFRVGLEDTIIPPSEAL
jgi:hypothetical protein